MELLFSANAGEPLQPLGRVASGGELSRLALALKTVLIGISGVNTMVFDEIDTGVGGVTAQKMAEKLALIARRGQVICITHLAQIAAFGDRHIRIRKETKENRTRTSLTTLDETGRVEPGSTTPKLRQKVRPRCLRPLINLKTVSNCCFEKRNENVKKDE